jgi:hypothetical protein
VTFPTGRPPSAIEYARRVTSNGQELVEHALRDMRGEEYVVAYKRDALGRFVLGEDGQPVAEYAIPSKKVQAQAREFLADRGLLPRVQVDITQKTQVNVDIDLTRVPLEKARAYLALKRELLLEQSTPTGHAVVESVQDAEFTE